MGFPFAFPWLTSQCVMCLHREHLNQTGRLPWGWKSDVASVFSPVSCLFFVPLEHDLSCPDRFWRMERPIALFSWHSIVESGREHLNPDLSAWWINVGMLHTQRNISLDWEYQVDNKLRNFFMSQWLGNIQMQRPKKKKKNLKKWYKHLKKTVIGNQNFILYWLYLLLRNLERRWRNLQCFWLPSLFWERSLESEMAKDSLHGEKVKKLRAWELWGRLISLWKVNSRQSHESIQAVHHG